MTQDELYQKLVDLYVGDELPEDLAEDLQARAFANPALAKDIRSMRHTMSALQSVSAPVFGKESYQRVLYRLYLEGATPETRRAFAASQYQLPMSG